MIIETHSASVRARYAGRMMHSSSSAAALQNLANQKQTNMTRSTSTTSVASGKCSRSVLYGMIGSAMKPTTPGENYAASWALLHFLLEGKRGRYEKKLLDFFRELSDAAKHADAFDKAFGKVKWERFNEEWIAHCKWLVERARAERDGGEVPDMPR